MTTTQKSEVCPHRAARQRAAAASHASKAARKARLRAEVAELKAKGGKV